MNGAQVAFVLLAAMAAVVLLVLAVVIAGLHGADTNQESVLLDGFRVSVAVFGGLLAAERVVAYLRNGKGS